MGQYYKPIILGKNRKSIKGWWYSHKTGNGLKLMEHSYIGNSLVNCVENYLMKNKGANLVWAGDYADEERTKLTKSEAMKVWQEKVASGELTCSFNAFWASDCDGLYRPKSDKDENLYSKCDDYKEDDGTRHRGRPELEYDTTDNDNICYLINDTKKEFVDMWYTPIRIGGNAIHPLPLLTCEGNGRGGGDYWGLDDQYVGRWARDFIRVENGGYQYDKSLKDQGYKEIKPKFVEGYDLKQVLNQLSDLLPVALAMHDYNTDSRFVAEVRMATKTITNALPKITKSEKEVLDRLEKQAAERAQATATA